ncbi:unnamed protein product [Menidia menidia]|uniref:(Atlantic silverside) hypothetical protein n=1 Tax=Menidia menidia TaxID=238744 RepID=A0A8S4B431_9TELE|nr:unnamed protein product [Menidia menidia]
MSVALRAQLLLFLISLSSRTARTRYIEENDASDGLYSLLSLAQKRESEDFIFRRPLTCNIMSQSPEGSFTMVMPHQRRNCSFSIIYPVEIRLTDLSLGEAKSNEISPLKQMWSGCSGSGDFVELLGGNGVDTSKMLPVADLCFSVSGLGESQMKIGCDNSVVRLVSSGNYINRVSFQYRLLDQNELPKARENSLDNFCAVE